MTGTRREEQSRGEEKGEPLSSKRSEAGGEKCSALGSVSLSLCVVSVSSNVGMIDGLVWHSIAWYGLALAA